MAYQPSRVIYIQSHTCKRTAMILFNPVLEGYSRNERLFKIRFFWFPLFNGISTFMSYLMPKPSLYKNSSHTINILSRDKSIHTYPKGISSEVNVIV